MEHHELLEIADFLSFLELILIITISYIGAIVHEYLFIPKEEIKPIRNPLIWTTVIVDVVICFSINPYIIEVNPRLVLLPPLIIGLLGNELIKRLTSINGVIEIFEYILGLLSIFKPSKFSFDLIEKIFGFFNKKKEIKEDDKQEEKQDDKSVLNPEELKNTVRYQKLKNEIVLISLDLDNLLLEYYSDETNKAVKFISCYPKLKTDIEVLLNNVKLYSYIPVEDAMKVSDIIRKSIELDRTFAYLTQNTKEYIKNTTSK